MKAKYINLQNEYDTNIYNEIGQAIHEQKLVVFPTETVYGLGANGLDESAVKKIFEAKGRNPDNPLILHISSLDMLPQITKDVNDVEKKLIDAFFPGPFTLILNRKDNVPNAVTAGLDTVAVRMPSNEIAQKIIQAASVPIAAPSANISGKPSGTIVGDIIEELGDKVDYIIDGGMCNIGLESTVVRVIDNIPTILRPGKITKEQIMEVVGKVAVDKNVYEKCDDTKKILSPGVKYKHYAPNTKCIMVYSDNNEALVSKANEIIESVTTALVISTTENINKYKSKYKLDVGHKNNLEEISKNIFTTLRKVDEYNVDLVVIEGVPKTGLGLAIMNRLIRACEYNYIEC